MIAVEAQEVADAARLIPAYDINATTPEDAYPLHNIIPEPEWSALDAVLSSLKSADSPVARLKCLPNSRSSWVKQHLNQAYEGKPRSQVVCVFKHICIAAWALTVCTEKPSFISQR
jgi:DNA-directed RNA polymerase I subunit RPA49